MIDEKKLLKRLMVYLQKDQQGVARITKEFGYRTRATVQNWVRLGYIPRFRMQQLEAFLNRELNQ